MSGIAFARVNQALQSRVILPSPKVKYFRSSKPVPLHISNGAQMYHVACLSRNKVLCFERYLKVTLLELMRIKEKASLLTT